MNTLNLLLISKNEEGLAQLGSALAEGQQHRVSHCRRAVQAYETVAAEQIDAVIVDEEIDGGGGLEFIQELMRSHPFINCALVCSLHPDEFHEATEGYGVFMQLPPRPGQEEAAKICAHLAKII